MAVGTVTTTLAKWKADLILVGIGVVCIVLGTVQHGTFGDGETVGAGAMALGAGIRGLVSQG